MYCSDGIKAGKYARVECSEVTMSHIREWLYVYCEVLLRRAGAIKTNWSVHVVLEDEWNCARKKRETNAILQLAKWVCLTRGNKKGQGQLSTCSAYQKYE
jgi:hypothetical protein